MMDGRTDRQATAAGSEPDTPVGECGPSHRKLFASANSISESASICSCHGPPPAAGAGSTGHQDHMLCPEHLWGCLQGRGAEEEASWTNSGSLSLTTRRVWNWGRSELRRRAQPGVRLAGGVQADPNVWRAGVACWRRALGTRYVRGGAICGWLSITGSSIGGGVNSERDTRTLAWRGGYGHPHPSVWQAPLRLWSRTTIRPLRSHNQLCHHLSEACLGP